MRPDRWDACGSNHQERSQGIVPLRIRRARVLPCSYPHRLPTDWQPTRRSSRRRFRVTRTRQQIQLSTHFCVTNKEKNSKHFFSEDSFLYGVTPPDASHRPTSRTATRLVFNPFRHNVLRRALQKNPTKSRVFAIMRRSARHARTMRASDAPHRDRHSDRARQGTEIRPRNGGTLAPFAHPILYARVTFRPKFLLAGCATSNASPSIRTFSRHHSRQVSPSSAPHRTIVGGALSRFRGPRSNALNACVPYGRLSPGSRRIGLWNSGRVPGCSGQTRWR